MAAAAGSAIARSFVFSNTYSSSSSFYFSFYRNVVCSSHLSRIRISPSSQLLVPPSMSSPELKSSVFSAPCMRAPFSRRFCSESRSESPKRSTLVNFSFSDADSDSEDSKEVAKPARRIDKSKLPPPYDPFSKKPAIEEPEDPRNLQEVFHNMGSEGGLMNSAVKMLDGLSKDGLTHEALELFSKIKSKGNLPEVVGHTAVIEAYADAGQAKEAHRAYMRMLASGVLPNAYTYSVLIRGLARGGGGGDWKLVRESKKYLVEMMEKGMKPNAGTYVAVVEATVKGGKAEEGREAVEEMKKRGFAPNERAAREAMKDRRGGDVFRRVMDVLFGKW